MDVYAFGVDTILGCGGLLIEDDVEEFEMLYLFGFI